MDWALRGALVLLAGAAVWFVVAIVRPMPTGGEPTTPPIPALTAIPEHAASIDDRQRRLSSLNAGGNIFAGDRRNWPIEIAADDGPGETIELTTVRGNPDAMTPIEVGSTDIDQIELAVNVSAAIRKRLEQLKLRGVFAIGDRKTAMIGQKTNTASEAYREGDTFDDGEWRVVAIDVERDRVILSRSGQNFELKLYDTGAVAAAPRASINATNTPGEVEIGFTSLDKVAGELRDAGMPREQINELIALAQEQPGEDAAPAEEAADPGAREGALKDRERERGLGDPDAGRDDGAGRDEQRAAGAEQAAAGRTDDGAAGQTRPEADADGVALPGLGDDHADLVGADVP